MPTADIDTIKLVPKCTAIVLEQAEGPLLSTPTYTGPCAMRLEVENYLRHIYHFGLVCFVALCK